MPEGPHVMSSANGYRRTMAQGSAAEYASGAYRSRSSCMVVSIAAHGTVRKMPRVRPVVRATHQATTGSNSRFSYRRPEAFFPRICSSRTLTSLEVVYEDLRI